MFALIFLSVFLKLFQGIGFRHFATHDRLVSLGKFAHLLFYFREVVLADGRSVFGHYVIEEAVLYGRTKAELNAGVERLQSFGQQVSRRMPEGVFAFLVFPFVKRNRCVFVYGAVKLGSLAVYANRQYVAR